MVGPNGRPVQGEQAPALEDPIHDGVREIVVVEDAAPRRDGLVRRKDHGSLLPVAVVDDVEEHVGGVRAIGEVADLIDHEHAGMDVRGEDLGEGPTTKRGREIVDEFGGRDEARVRAMEDGAVGNGNGQVSRPDSGGLRARSLFSLLSLCQRPGSTSALSLYWRVLRLFCGRGLGPRRGRMDARSSSSCVERA